MSEKGDNYEFDAGGEDEKVEMNEGGQPTEESAQDLSKSKNQKKSKKVKEKKLPKIPVSKYFPEFEKNLPDLTGKVVVITGTTSGTGKVAAMTSLKKGATVALLNRNEAKAQKALEEFFATNEGTEDRAVFITCDLQSFKSVEAAGEELLERFADEGIDVICNNAGVMALADEATEDGYDVQMQTNHLSHFMLTRIIFPLLTKRAEAVGEARVVNHSSVARLLPPSSLAAKYYQKKGGSLGGNGSNMVFGARWKRYHQSKLANSVFTCEMQKRLNAANSKVIAFCAHPGLAATELQVTTAKEGGLNGLGFMNRAQSQEDGTMGILKCMFMPNLIKGALYGPKWATGKAVHVKHGMFTTSSAGKTLWKESEQACGNFVIEPNQEQE